MNYAANDVVLGRHLDKAEKRIKREIDKIAAGGASVAVFTGATTTVGGTSGLAPAPQAGDESKFLRGDGTWSDELILPTVASTVDGGIWYEVTDGAPSLWLRYGSYGYKFVPDANVRYADDPGSNPYRKAFLPFDSSATEDTYGNTWATQGNATLDTTTKKFGAASLHLPAGAYIQAENIIDIEAEQWTFDTWLLRQSGGPILGFGAADRYWGINIDDGEIMFGGIYHNGWDRKFKYDSTFPSSEWFHFAIVKDGLTFYLFCNGSLFWNPTVAALDANSNVFRLGGHELYGNDGDMYFDNVRFTEGVARWTEDFTPPTAADYA